MSDDLDKATLSAMSSFTRTNITSAEWHKANPKFAHYWLGFRSWGEFIIYHQCLWPKVSTEVLHSNKYISDFEQSVITKMFFRKGNEFASLGWMWGRTNIGRYVKKWGPLWGDAGSDLSILDINEEILRALTPDDFKNGCTDKVCGLVDGKDFKIEIIRTHSGLTRAIHSNKVNCSALRVLSYVLNNGLNIERSDAYLGRASETHIVQVLGSHIGTVPIRIADKNLYRKLISIHKKRATPITDSARNVGLMIARRTKKKGEIMDGDEDPKDEEENFQFCDKIDSWLQSRMDAIGSGNETMKKKAKIYDSKDHAVLEKKVLQSGPNESPEAKLVQLRRHQRLHDQSGNLRSCLLSEYLKITETLRNDMLHVLRGQPLKGLNGEKLSTAEKKKRLKELRLPTRLGKFPPGWAILADRGFANDATRYPNMNVQMTPSFLSGRNQFTLSELSSDMVKCKLRYKSETNFARVTDENLLTDVIPFSALPFVNDCISWGHAHANLCQPYKKRKYV